MLAMVGLLRPGAARATDGAWSSTVSGGLWSNSANWNGQVMADGWGAVADFGELNVGASTTILLDAPRTLGALRFIGLGAKVHSWTLNTYGNSASVLTLAGADPSITITSGFCTNNVVIAGTTGVTVNGGAGALATLALSAANTFTGDLTLNAGRGGYMTVYANHTGVFGGSPDLPNTVILAGNEGGRAIIYLNAPVTKAAYPAYNSLIMRPTGASAASRAEFRSAGGNTTWDGLITFDGVGGSALARSDVYCDAGTFTLSGNMLSTNDFRGQLSLRGPGAGVINGTINVPGALLAKDDPGVWTINSTDNIWASTVIAFGTLKLGVDNALPVGTGLTLGGGAGAATFDLNGFKQTVATLTATGVNAKRITSSAGMSVLTVNNATDISYAGVLQGNLSLEKANTGILTLSGANTYTGSTIISGGTLAVPVTGNLSGSRNIIIHSGATFTAAGLRLVAGQKLSPADGTATMAGNLNVGDGTLVLNYSVGKPALKIAAGNLALGSASTVVINVTGSLVAGETYPLANWESAGQISGSTPESVVLNGVGAMTGSLDISRGQLYLVMDGSPAGGNQRGGGLSILSQTPFPSATPFTLFVGANPVCSVTASGTSPLSYKWFINGVRVAGATNSNLRWPSVKLGAMTAYCVVSDASGSVTSKAWSARVIEPPTVTYQEP